MAKNLYRDPVKGKIAGVCAGIAEYFNLEIWLVRIIFVSAFLLGFVLFPVIAYFAAVLLIEKKPYGQQFDHMENGIKQKPWQQGKTASSVLAKLDTDIANLERKVEQVERHVTSREFELNRQFKHL